MKIKTKQKVNTPLKETFEQFNQDLLKRLAPPLTSFRIEKFTGMSKGDDFVFYTGVLGIETKWSGMIIANFDSEKECYFIDIGKELPFPLSAWTHKHSFKKVNDQETYIIDEVEYLCKFKIFEYLMFPIWFIYFEYRRLMYRKIFNV